jgi:type I restriction enzyme S subunit
MVEFRPGDVLFGKLRPYLAKSWRADQEGLCSTELIVMRPRLGVDDRWVGYLAQSDALVEWAVATSEGVKMPRTSWQKLRQLEVVAPPSAEQHAICDYLDAETARIDQIVERLANANQLLDEWLAAKIEATIWSGDEPAMPLMHLTPGDRQIQYGIVLPGPDVPDGVPIVKGGNIVTGRLQAGGLARTTEEIETGFARSRLRRNDIVFAIRGAVGACAMVPEEVEGANITQDVARVSPLPSVDPSWLLYALKSRTLQQQAESRIVGATIRGINIRDLKRVRVPVPTLADQQRRAEALGHAQVHRDQVFARRQRQRDLLVERRQALITAAVTGELAIPGLAA